MECYHLHFHLQRHVWHTVGRELLEIFSDVGGSHFQILGERPLHFTHTISVLDILKHLLFYVGHGATEIFLDLFFRAKLVDKLVYTGIDLGHDHRVGHLHCIDIGLMQIKFLDCYHLGHDTVRIALDRSLLINQIVIIVFDLRFPDGLVAHNPCHLFGHIVLSVDSHRRKQHGGKRNNVSKFHCVGICGKQWGKFSEKC